MCVSFSFRVNTKKLSYRKVLPVLICAFLYINAYTQNDTLVFNPIRNQVLQQTEIRNFCIAKDGKLWLSTNKGIASFDGNEVKFFGHKESDINTMWTSSISLINPVKDRKENLFIVTISGPTYYFDTRTGKTTYLEIASNNLENYVPQPYSDIYVENDTSIWLARYTGRFLHYEISSKKTTYYDIADEKYGYKNVVTCIKADDANKELLWLGTNNGVYSFNTKSGVLQRNYTCNSIKDSTGDDIEVLNIDVKPDTIWFTTRRRGVGCYDIQTGKYTIFPQNLFSGQNKGLNIRYFQRKDDDEYYIGMEDRNPGIFNIKTHEYNFKTKITGTFPGIRLGKFLADSNGNCLCLVFGQLYYASNLKNKFTIADIPLSSFENNNNFNFKTVTYSSKDSCYYAAFDGSRRIYVFDKNIKYKKAIPIRSTNAMVNDLGLDEKGQLWVAGETLFLHDSKKDEMLPVEHFNPALKLNGLNFQNLVFRQTYLYTLPTNPSCKSIYRVNTTSFYVDSILLPEKMLSKTGGNHFGVLIMDSASNYAYLANDKILYQYNFKNKSTRLIQALRLESFPFSFHSNYHWYETDDSDNLWVSSNGLIRVYEPSTLKVLNKIQKTRDVYLLQSSNFNNLSIMGFVNSGGVELFDYKNNKQYRLGLGDGLITKINSGIACANNILFTGGEFNALEYMALPSAIKQNDSYYFYLSNIQLFNKPYISDTLPEYLSKLTLPYSSNYISLTFSCLEFDQPEKLEYRYRLQGVDENWAYVNYLNRTVSYTNLPPGTYTFYASAKNEDGSWNEDEIELPIIIIPAWWQTEWFKATAFISICILVFVFTWWRINIVRKNERQKAYQQQEKSKIEKELLELEAKALRAQMNPHFIFNCMNSIKSLIQQKEEDKAVSYLTTFSKLLRAILQNSDKKEISLFDEIETCRLYTQLESMRFGNKLSYSFVVDETIDLKSVYVPALIIQPFIENAIWHGIVPKHDGGNIIVTVEHKEHAIYCIIDDNGIGRELSKQNKYKGEPSTHQSKGVRLTQSRLELSNTLNQRNASVEIIDKMNSKGEPEGTKVILLFNED